MKTNIFSISIVAIFSLISISMLNQSVKADTAFLGISAEYNDVFFGDYYGRGGDIEGHAAIKGNVDVSGYSFGAWYAERHSTGRNVLVVGGNATISSTTVHDGDAYIGGTLTDHVGSTETLWNALTVPNAGVKHKTTAADYTPVPGNIYVGNSEGLPSKRHSYIQSFDDGNVAGLPFDFEIAEEQLRTAASQLSSLETSTAKAEVVNGKWILDLSDLDGIQVVDIDIAILNVFDSFVITAEADTTLIINLFSSDENVSIATFKGGSIIINGEGNTFDGDFDGSNILFNVDSSVEQINVINAKVNASFLALDTHFDVRKGNIEGQVFGASAYTENGGEFHSYYIFDDKHFDDGTFKSNETPEPATLLVLGLGLAGIPVARRFRKK